MSQSVLDDADSNTSMPPRPLQQAVTILFAVTLLAVLVHRTSASVIDPDLWHEMALGRETVRAGAVPWEEKFAYTPTVYPSVHHEWGTGVIAYGMTALMGASGILLAKYLLVFGLAATCWLTGRAGGASTPVLGSFALLAIFMIDYGFSPIRAQMFSFVFTALLCSFLQMDQAGSRRWIGVWIPIYVLWLNLHAGFLVGAGLFFLYWVEQFARRQSHRHLLWTGIAMIPLIAINPYGLHYVKYLAHAVTMNRPLISEWGPIWQSADIHNLVAFVIAISLFGVSLWRVGWRGYPGVLLLIVSAGYSILHMRMLGLFAIVWLCFVPRHFEISRFAATLRESWRERPLPWVVIWGGAVMALGIAIYQARPWQLLVPGHRVAGGRTFSTYYPVGPVAYLQKSEFQGNLMTPFDFGAYVIWKTDGRVRVSMDSRYEVAYPLGALEANYNFYKFGRNVTEALADGSTDAILVPQWSPATSVLTAAGNGHQSWSEVYVDDDFQIFVRQRLMTEFVRVDAKGKVFWGQIP